MRGQQYALQPPLNYETPPLAPQVDQTKPCATCDPELVRQRGELQHEIQTEQEQEQQQTSQQLIQQTQQLIQQMAQLEQLPASQRNIPAELQAKQQALRQINQALNQQQSIGGQQQTTQAVESGQQAPLVNAPPPIQIAPVAQTATPSGSAGGTHTMERTVGNISNGVGAINPSEELFIQSEAQTGLPSPAGAVRFCVACSSQNEALKFLNGEPSQCSVMP